MTTVEPIEPSSALHAEVHRDCARIARQRRMRFGVVSLAALGGTLGFGFAAGLKAPHGGSPAHLLVLIGYIAAAATMMGLAFGIRLPSGRRLLPVVAAGLVVAFVLIGTTVDGTAGPPLLAGTACLWHGLIVSAAVLVMGLGVGGRVLRRHAPTGLLLGLGAGLFGLVPLHLACGSCAASHVFTWHAAVPLFSSVFAGLAWALLRGED